MKGFAGTVRAWVVTFLRFVDLRWKNDRLALVFNRFD